jgi:hypothetical protein
MNRLLPLALLAACAPEALNPLTMVDDAQPPPPYGATLWVSPCVAGDTVTMVVDNAMPGDTLRPVLGSPGTFCSDAIAPLCSDLAGPFTLLRTATADATGKAVITVTVPPSRPVGFSGRIQVFGGLNGTPYATNAWDRTVTSSCPGDSDACNLLTNRGFDDWVAPWDALPNVLELSHSPVDRSADPASGSLMARNLTTGSYTSAHQCVPVESGVTYLYDGYAFLPDTSTGASSFAEYIFYANDNCSGSLQSFGESTSESTTGVWTLHELTFTAPATAGSVSVGHGIITNTSADPVVYIDDVSMVAL